jgi:hypothetical protein
MSSTSDIRRRAREHAKRERQECVIMAPSLATHDHYLAVL